MLRKLLIMFLIMTSVLVLGIFSFASELNKTEIVTISDKIELISPEIATDGKAILDGNLYISLRYKGEEKLFISLVKLEPQLIQFDDIVLKSTDKVQEANTEATTETTTEENQSDEGAVTDPAIEATEDTETNPLEAAGADSLPVEVMAVDKTKLIEDIKVKKQEFNVANLEFETLYERLILTYNDLSFLNNPEALATDEKIVSFYFQQAKLKELVKELTELKRTYDKLFETIILEKTPVVIDSFIPYFEMELEGVNTGNYKIDFYLENGVTPVKSVKFTVGDNAFSGNMEEEVKEQIEEFWNLD